MIVKNITSESIDIIDIRNPFGTGNLVLPSNVNVTLFNEDTERSSSLKYFIDQGDVTIIDAVAEPNTGTSVSDDPEVAGGLTDHGSLLGLTDDDHAQYLLADGSRQVDGTLVTYKDNATSFRVAGKDFNGDDVQSYFGVFYHQDYDLTGGIGAKKSRLGIGGNEKLAVEIQSSNDLRLSAIDGIVGGGTIRMAAADKIDMHVGGAAETDALVAKVEAAGISLLAKTTITTAADVATLNVPVVTSDPGTLVDGDVWIKDDTGTITLNVRVSGATKSVTLT